MKYGIEAQAGTPAYLQLYRQMREDIVQGVYPHGGRLPSKRTLAAETGVSTVTAEHAYALLCDEGYAESRERSGYFVCFRAGDGLPPRRSPAARARRRRAAGLRRPSFPSRCLRKRCGACSASWERRFWTVRRTRAVCGCARRCGNIWRAAAGLSRTKRRSSSAPARNTCTG